MTSARIIQHHSTNIKWYAEVLLEENPWMSLREAVASASARYAYPGLNSHDQETVRLCASGIQARDLSWRTRIAVRDGLKPYCRNWFERLCVWLEPYF
jgi:hypothetical protein